MTTARLLHDLLDVAAERWPERVALRHGADSATYATVRTCSERLAAWLIELGVRPGNRVLIVVPGDVLVPALLFACSRVGAVHVLLHPDAPPAAVAHVLDDATPATLVTGRSDLVRVAEDRGIPIHGPDAVRTAAERPRRFGGVGGPTAVDPACFIYTSGSTAMPKAVVCTHLQMTFAAQAIQSRLEYRPDDVVYCALPISFDYGLYQIFLATMAGAQLVLASAAGAGQRLAVELRDAGATVLPAVPSLADNLARLLVRRPLPLPRLGLLTNTGAAMPTTTLALLRERLPNLRVQLMYGLTECKRATIMPKDEDRRRPGSCGLGLPGTAISIVDDAGRPRPAGSMGEIVVRGPNVMAGYWRRPDLTRERFVLDDGIRPSLHTGDYGWLDDEGYLYLVGRRDDLYKERGCRVSAIEVEAAARGVPGVDAAVVLVPEPGKDGATIVVAGRVSAAEVLGGMRDRIDALKIPRRCVVVPDLPLTASGKVARTELAELARDHAFA